MFILSYTENSDYGVRNSVTAWPTLDAAQAEMDMLCDRSVELLDIDITKACEEDDGEDDTVVICKSEHGAYIRFGMDTYSWVIHEFPDFVPA